MRFVALVVPELSGAGLRFLRAGLSLPETRIGLITEAPREACPRGIAGHWRIENVLDSDALRLAAEGIAQQLGGLHRFFAVQEQLQLPVAIARAELGLPGMSPESVHCFRDKARMKARLRDAGVRCARFGLAHDADEARTLAREIGYPLVAKPPSGAGAADTHRVSGPGPLEQLLSHAPPRAGDPMLLEEFLTGEEFAFDSVWVDGRMVWHSISAYLPSCLEVKENPWIQWSVLMPRNIQVPEFDAIRDTGVRALKALGLETGMSHMEWFRLRDGTVAIGEAGARPPGAQFTTLLGLAHDANFYSAWMKLMIHGEFTPPSRNYAAGGAYLRAMGHGRVRGVRGIEEIFQRHAPIIAEARVPEPGSEAAEGYEGQGYVLVRHPETDAVAAALRDIVATARVEI